MNVNEKDISYTMIILVMLITLANGIFYNFQTKKFYLMKGFAPSRLVDFYNFINSFSMNYINNSNFFAQLPVLIMVFFKAHDVKKFRKALK